MSTTHKPSENRPFNIECSKGEVVALVKFNLRQMGRIGKVFSQKALEIKAGRPLTGMRELRVLRELCQEEMKKYADRAKGLASILK